MRARRIFLPLVAAAAIAGAAASGPVSTGDHGRPVPTAAPVPRAVEAAACKRTSRVVIVNLDNTTADGDPKDHLPVLRHAWAAVSEGQPEVWHIARGQADANRAASLRDVPSWGQLTVVRRQHIDPDGWRLPHDRDEYPPAFADEGGKGADVAYIVASVNRSAGAVMGAQLAGYCDGQAARYERKPGPRPRP